MKLRKTISVILSASILISVIFACVSSASAASAYSVYSDSDLTATAGSTISIPMCISENQGLMGYDMSFTFDDKVLTPVSVTRGSILTNGYFQDDIEGTTSTSNRFRVTWSNTNQSTENGIMFYVNFSIDALATGSTEITVDYDKTDTYNEDFDKVTLNCSSINLSIQNNEYDGSPIFYIKGNDIAAGNVLSLDFYAENIGSMKSVTLTIPYDSTNFRYSGIEQNSVQATATNNGDSITVVVSGLNNAQAGRIFTLKFQSEVFATSKEYIFSAQYSNIVGTEKMLVKGTEISITSTADSDAIVIYSNETNTTVSGEEQIVIPLYIKHNTGLMGYTITFNYDPSVLEAVSVNGSGSFSGNLFTNIEKKLPGEFTCMWFGDEDIFANGDFITLTFNVLSAKESVGKITVSYNETDIISEKIDGVRISFPEINYTVNKSKFQIGDTNLDGSITISDVTEIQKHIAELIHFSDEQILLADTNGDGVVNITDATHLQKYLAEFDGIVLGKQN